MEKTISNIKNCALTGIDTRWSFVVIGFFFLLNFNTLLAQPVVVTQPRDTSICVESSAEFNIVAVNTSGYQWQENDGVGWYNLDPSFTYVDGEYTPNLFLHDANLALNGYQYRCVVSDVANDKDTSAPAILGVYEPPIVTSNPINQRVCKSDIAVFSIDAINGTNYQWYEHNGVGWIQVVDNSFYEGSQTPDLSVYTVTGMDGYLYRCVAKNVTCPDTSEYALLIVDPTPIIYTVTGGGGYCEGDDGVLIGLNSSELGISYNLMIDGEETGVVRDGTGLGLDFGKQSLEGNYTVVAYNQFTSCSIEMSGNVQVMINPLPLDFEIQGGGTVCQGDVPPNIFILNSEPQISYSLFRNAVFTGITMIGTGASINFGVQNEAGFYTIIAENPVTQCSRQLSGMAEVVIQNLPVSNAGSDHNIVQGSSTQLQGTASGGSGNYDYEWSPSNLCVSYSSSSTQTSNLYISTIFTFEVTDSETGCSSLPDTSIVYVNSGTLNVQAFTGNNSICMGESVNLVALASGGTGNYSYLWTSSPPGFSSGQQNVTVTPSVSTVYTITVSDGIDNVISTVSITVFPLPLEFNVMGGGSYCFGDQGVDISLSGSETGIRYSLYYQQSSIESILGDGGQLDFGNYTEPGSYTILARNENYGCSSTQNGNAIVDVNELPVAEAGPNFLINAGSFTTLNGSASGGSGSGYLFSWSPQDLLINPQTQNPSTVPLNNTTLYNLQVTDDNGCTGLEDNAIVFVTGGQISLEVLTSGSPVCPGSEVQLYAMASGGSGSFSYFWQSSPVGFTSTSFNPMVYPTVTTTYIVTVNDGLDILTDSVTIIVNPLPIAYSVMGGGEVCSGNDPANILLAGSETGIDYNLLKDGANTGMSLSGTGFALDFGIWNTDGNYTVHAQNLSTLCAGEMQGNAVVTINELPVSYAGTDQMIPGGTSTILSGSASGASGTYEYQWEPSYLCVSPTNISTSTQPINQSILFTFQAIDAQTQCESLPDTVIVFTQGDELYANASSSPTSVCEGEELTLTATAGGGTGNYSYLWSSNPVGFTSAQSTTTVYPQVSTTYYLDVFDGISHVFDTVEVVVLPNPVTFAIDGGGGYCSGGDGLYIGLTGSETGAIYKLYRSPSEFVTQLSGTGLPLDFGTFTQSGSYYSISIKSAVCQKTMSGVSEIVENQNPLADAGNDQMIQFGGQAILNGNATLGSGNYNYLWSPGDSLVVPNVQQPQTVPLHNTLMYNLVVTDASTGCESEEDNSIVFVTGGPFTLQSSSDASSICFGDSTQLFSFPSGGSGDYTFLWTSIPAGFTSTDCCPVVSPLVTTVYDLSVTDGTTTLSDFVSVIVNPSPLAYSLSGGGEVCYGNQSDNIILQNSELNMSYSLLRDGIETGVVRAGTGFEIDFGSFSQNGQYSVFATENTTLCSNTMAGEVSVIVNQLPIADAGQDVLIARNTATVLSGNASAGTGSYSYQWEPVTLCQNPQNQSTATVPLSQSTLFTLNVLDLQTLCNSLDDTVFVFTSGDQLDVTISASTLSICAGESVSLVGLPSGGSGSYSYSWTSLPAGINLSEMSITVQPLQPTTYIVEVFDGVDYVTDSVFIQVAQFPDIYTVTGGGSYCVGETGPNIELSGSDQGVNYSLFYYPDNELNSVVGTGNALDFGNYTVDGDYYVVANALTACSEQMNGTVTIQSNQLPLADAGDDQLIDFGQQTILFGFAQGGSGDYNYIWAPNDSLINPLSQNTTTVPLHNSLMFTLSVFDNQTGCNGVEDNALVFVSGNDLTLAVSASNETICSGEETTLYAIPSGGSGNYTYLWSSIPVGFSSSNYNPNVLPTVTTKYFVMVSDGVTTLTDSIIIVVNSSPVTYNLLGGGAYCEGGSGQNIFLDGSDENVNYELFNDLGTTGILLPGLNDTLNFGSQVQTGYYWVVAQSVNSSCFSDMNDTVQIWVNQLAVADAGNDKYIEEGTSAQFDGSASGGSGYYNYFWSPDYLFVDPNIQNPLTTPLNESTLFNLLVGDQSYGCISSPDTVIAYVVHGELSVVASATPNEICEGEQVFLGVVPTGGSGNYSYYWSSNPEGFYSNIQFPEDSPTQSTTYFVEVSDGDTVVYDTVAVDVQPSPTIFNVIGGGSYCVKGDGVVISLSGSQDLIQYTLYLNNDIEVISLLGTGSPIDFGDFTTEGTYTVFAGNQQSGCSKQMAGSAVVTQYPLPFADAGIDITIPLGTNATLDGSGSGGTGDYSYFWIPTEKLLNPTDPDATTVALSETSMFSLKVTDENNCESNSSNVIVFISGGPLSVNIANSNNNICPGEQTTLNALPSGGIGSYSYYWESIPVGFVSTSPQINVTPNVPTWYKITIYDAVSSITDSVLINMLPTPEQYQLLGGGGYCSDNDGVEIYLENSSLSTTYTLFHNTIPTGEYVFGTGSQITFGNFITEGNYMVIAQNENGCSALMQNVVQVFVNPLPLKFQLYGGGTYCENDPTLGVLLESSQQNVSYQLFKDDQPTGIAKSGTGLPLSFIDFSGSAVYSVLATNIETGCTNTMNGVASMLIHDKPNISISGKTNICFGESVLLSGSGGYNYEWNTFPVQHTPDINVTPTETTNYQLLGFSTNGCSDTASHTVEVYDQPEIQITNDEITLTVVCLPASLYNYDFYMGDVLLQSGSQNTWYYGDMGLISDTIKVVGSNQSGCSDESEIFLELKEPPNAFSPNGDGVNDLFLVGYDIQVFSSWGSEVFSGDTGWDGKFEGEYVVPGTYYYIHKIYNTDGTLIKTIKGSVTVVTK